MLDVQESGSNGLHGSLDPVGGVQLGDNALDVLLGGDLGDVQGSSDFLVGKTFHNLHKHLSLPRGQGTKLPKKITFLVLPCVPACVGIITVNPGTGDHLAVPSSVNVVPRIRSGGASFRM